ncbi:hypothetical protein LMG24076_05344 [Trinickia soli]|nr:hypothetical protein LMG24076_05344 [Trinickia soli]
MRVVVTVSGVVAEGSRIVLMFTVFLSLACEPPGANALDPALAALGCC